MGNTGEGGGSSGGDSIGTSETATTDWPSSTTGDAQSTATGFGDDGTGELEPLCGDGVLDAGESCDEPNGQNADGCNEDCTVSGEVIWSRVVGGRSGESSDLFGVDVAPDGRAYVAGALYQVVEQSDLWLAQLHPDGSGGWDFVLDGTGHSDDAGRAVTLVNNSVYVAGVVSLSENDEQWWVRKFSLDGAGGWSNLYGGTLSDAPRGLAVDTAERVYVAGRAELVPADSDIVVRRLLDGGVDDWVATHGGTALGFDGARGVALAPTGRLAVAGYTTVAGQGLNGWVSLYGLAGEQLWTREIQGAVGLDEVASGVAVDEDGAIYAVGYEQPASGGSIGWIRRWDGSGKESWTRTWVGEGPLALASYLAVAVDQAGCIVVAGWEQTDMRRGLLVKYDSSGAVLWRRTMEGSNGGGTQLRAVTVGPGDHVWAAGNADRGPDEEGVQGWIIRVAP